MLDMLPSFLVQYTKALTLNLFFSFFWDQATIRPTQLRYIVYYTSTYGHSTKIIVLSPISKCYRAKGLRPYMAKFFIDKYANVYSITVMTTHRIYKAYHIMPAVLEGWAYWFYCDEAEDRIIYGDGEIRQPYLSTEVFSRLEAKEISTLELLIIFGIDKG